MCSQRRRKSIQENKLIEKGKKKYILTKAERKLKLMQTQIKKTRKV